MTWAAYALFHREDALVVERGFLLPSETEHWESILSGTDHQNFSDH